MTIEPPERAAGTLPSGLIGAAQSLKLPAPAHGLTASVVVPARDEADNIEATIRALAAQVDLQGVPLPRSSYEIIVLANNCADGTAALARKAARQHRDLVVHVAEVELPDDLAHVGSARRLAMDEACRRLLDVGHLRGIIATTDADTAVAPTWLAATLGEVAAGVDAVGGRILVDPHELHAMPRIVRERFLRNVGYWALADEVDARVDPRPHDPWPHHDQFFGASLAVTARAYREVGGLPVLPSGEDVALKRALHRADVAIRHSPQVQVTTSARLLGRTPGGLAALLGSWAQAPSDRLPQVVPGLPSVLPRAAARRLLRELWLRASAQHDLCDLEVAGLAEVAGVPRARLEATILGAETVGALIDDVVAQATWPGQGTDIDIRTAIADLRGWLEPYRRPGAPPPVFARHLRGLPLLRPARQERATTRRVPAASAPLEQVQPIGRRPVPPQVA